MSATRGKDTRGKGGKLIREEAIGVKGRIRDMSRSRKTGEQGQEEASYGCKLVTELV